MSNSFTPRDSPVALCSATGQGGRTSSSPAKGQEARKGYLSLPWTSCRGLAGQETNRAFRGIYDRSQT